MSKEEWELAGRSWRGNETESTCLKTAGQKRGTEGSTIKAVDGKLKVEMLKRTCSCWLLLALRWDKSSAFGAWTALWYLNNVSLQISRETWSLSFSDLKGAEESNISVKEGGELFNTETTVIQHVRDSVLKSCRGLGGSSRFNHSLIAEAFLAAFSSS